VRLPDSEVRAELERVQAELTRERKRSAALERALAAKESLASSRGALAARWLRARWRILLAVAAGLAFAWLTAYALATSGWKSMHRLDAESLSGLPLAPRMLPTPTLR
jgi:hypothetical protein